jgi:hypothetical protein
MTVSKFTTIRPSGLPALDPSHYPRHALHAEDRVWVEKNCYIDIWIEVLHALKLEPLAVLPFTVALDFEGDQWTFFKPPHDELRDLYGIDVQELNVWRPLLDHAIEHVGAGKLISTEADAFWLPDTAGTDYQSSHTKTTIVIAEIDVEAERMGYFHNAGYYTLADEDFRRVLRIRQPEEAPLDANVLPLFAELLRIDGVVRRPATELAAASAALLRKHLARVPAHNPVAAFRERFGDDLPWLQEQGLAHYHAWAFGTIRQLGAAFEALAMSLRWQERHGAGHHEEAAAAFDRISTTCKTLILKAARAVNSRKPLDVSELLGEAERAWETGIHALKNRRH